MDKELVEIREATDPPDSEEARRWTRSNRRDKIGEPCLFQSEPAPLGKLAPTAGDDESWRGEMVMFTQHKMCSEVVRCPPIEKRRGIGAEFVQQIAELCALDRVKPLVGHEQQA